MKHGALVVLAAFLAMVSSWAAYVLAPQIQIGRLQPETNVVNRTDLYPLAPPGLARQGEQVYRANGCAACHTEQVRQTGIHCDVILTKPGTNSTALVKALVQSGLSTSQAKRISSRPPKTVEHGLTKDHAETIVRTLEAAGATVQLDFTATGPDIARGWGLRRTVAADYLYDDPVMLGSLRVGPDLANEGVQRPDANWQLRHLYAPRSEVKHSPMPPFRFLFKQEKIQWHPSPDALHLPKTFAPPPGYEIVPTPAAKALVAYLLSRRADAPLFELPMGSAAAPSSSAPTNAPVK